MNSTAALVAGAAGLTVVGYLSAGHLPPARVLVGAGIAGAGLLIVDASHHELAAGLAAVIFLTSLLTNGAGVAGAIARLIGGK